MSLKKFGSRDIITNTMRTHPSCEFFVFDGKVYYNNIPYASGTINRGASVPITAGYASLYELNVDRLSSSIADQADADGSLANRSVGSSMVPPGAWPVPSEVVDNGLIYPFVTKDGTRLSLKTLYTGSTYEMDFLYGDIVSGSYPLSASIARELIGWYPKLEGGDITALPDLGPYDEDTSGGSRGAGELITGNPCLTSNTNLDIHADRNCGAIKNQMELNADLATEEECKSRTLPSDETSPADFEYTACNSPKWRSFWSLKNLFRRYEYLSEHYAVTASYGLNPHTLDRKWIKDQQLINLISIPSIFYGAKIKPGSVSLKWYLTGTLIGELQDTKRNGELIQVTGNNPYITQYGPANAEFDSGVDNVAGVIFYNEGFIALTGSWHLNHDSGSQLTIRSGSGNTFYSPMWIDWGAGANDNCNRTTTSNSGGYAAPLVVSASNNLFSASFGLSLKGTSEVQTLTMFAHAKRGEANFSNNPTFLALTQSATSSFITSSHAYVEGPDRLVYNFVSSSQADYSASFKRQVYISKVGLYDANKNLIGVASMASPVRKEEDQDLTFKLKLDI